MNDVLDKRFEDAKKKYCYGCKRCGEKDTHDSKKTFTSLLKGKVERQRDTLKAQNEAIIARNLRIEQLERENAELTRKLYEASLDERLESALAKLQPKHYRGDGEVSAMRAAESMLYGAEEHMSAMEIVYWFDCLIHLWRFPYNGDVLGDLVKVENSLHRLMTENGITEAPQDDETLEETVERVERLVRMQEEPFLSLDE